MKILFILAAVAAASSGDTRLMLQVHHPEIKCEKVFEKIEDKASRLHLLNPMAVECGDRFRAEAAYFGWDLNSVRNSKYRGVAIRAKYVSDEDAFFTKNREFFYHNSVILTEGQPKHLAPRGYNMTLTLFDKDCA
jgi:hypothetical protein